MPLCACLAGVRCEPLASFWASTASTCMSLTRQPTGCEWDGAGPGLCSRPGPNLKPLRDQPPNMGGGVGERLLLVQNKTRLPRNPSHTPASWHKPWSAMTPIGAERRRWFAFSPTQRLLVSSSCHWVMTTLPRVCCTQGSIQYQLQTSSRVPLPRVCMPSSHVMA